MRPAPVLQTTFHLNDSGSILSSKADFPKSLIGSTGLEILLFPARRNPLKKAKTDIKKPRLGIEVFLLLLRRVFSICQQNFGKKMALTR